MTTLRWGVAGVFSSLSRTDPDALASWAPTAKRFVVEYPSLANHFATKEEAVAYWAGLAPEDYYPYYLGYIPERVSYPTLYAGPTSVYLPDVNVAYSEYPYTVQGYAYSFTAFRGINPDLYYTTLVIAQGLSNDDIIPPPPDPGNVDPITIQLKRDGTGTYSVKPSDASVLTKYAVPFKVIRAQFNTTRVAVIEETLGGGFMIYEEVASVAVSPVYVYTSKRRLQEIITANLIPQYRLAII